MKTTLLAFALTLLSTFAQTLTFQWDSTSVGTSFRVVCTGPAGQTNWTTSTTNLTVPISQLFVGTNKIQVAELWVSPGGTTASVSDLSAPVFVIRKSTPVLRLGVLLEVSTNLTAWVDSEDQAIAIASADRALQFWRPRAQKIEVAANPPPVVDESLDIPVVLPLPPSPR